MDDRPLAALEKLPAELLNDILVYSHSSSLPIASRSLLAWSRNIPASVRALFLIEHWLAAYLSPGHFRYSRYGRPRFLPALSESADPNVIDYCVKFALCTPTVLTRIERRIETDDEFGNYRIAVAIDAKALGMQRAVVRWDDLAPIPSVSAVRQHFWCTTLPKRLFTSMSTVPSSDGVTWDSTLLQILSTFGPPPYPPLDTLLVLARLLLNHRPVDWTSRVSYYPPAANSLEGYPLARATLFRSRFLVYLLLAFEASPSLKDSFSIRFAVRIGWLEGVKILIERDEREELRWSNAILRLKAWLECEEESWLSGLQGASTEDHAQADRAVQVAVERPTKAKRRRLTDRAKIDAAMMVEAVRKKHWAMVDWFMEEKGVVPDMDVINRMQATRG